MKSTKTTTGKSFYNSDSVVKLSKKNYIKIKKFSILAGKDISSLLNSLVDSIELSVKS